MSLTRRSAYADLAVAMGGRVAEEEIFGYEKVTSGASADIKMATGLARAMATEFGMSRQARTAALRRQPGRGVPWPLDDAASAHMSDDTQKVVDEEVKRFVEEGYTHGTARDPREHRRAAHHRQALLEYETLTGDEIRDLMNGIPPVREDGAEVAPKTTGVPSAGRPARKRPDAEPDGAPEPQPGA